MKHDFKIGDIVKCVHIYKFQNCLTIGRTYEILDVEEFTVDVMDDIHIVKSYSKYYFEIDVIAKRDIIIDDILNGN